MQNTSEPVPGAAREIRLLVIHCADTPNDRTLFSGRGVGLRTPVMEIDLWHKQRGFHRDSYWRGRQNSRLESIGYHYVVARNGAIFTGRHDQEVGAHAQGWNSSSLGICLVGTDSFTEVQWLALESCVRALSNSYQIPLMPPSLIVQGKLGSVQKRGIEGHGKLPGANKSCPGFVVADWLAGGLKPLKGHLSSAPAPTL